MCDHAVRGGGVKVKRRFLEQETNLVWKKLSDGTFHSRSQNMLRSKERSYA